MAAVAHNPAFAKRVGISKEVGEHFMAKDKGKKFGAGGDTGSANEAMKPFAPPDPDVERGIDSAASDAEKKRIALVKQNAAEKAAREAELKKRLAIPPAGHKRGGSIHKFKAGGHVDKDMDTAKIFAKAGEKKLAAHERREAAGKEKDTPAIAKKEEAALKKAKAPKDIQEHEKAEHKAMGYKKGGHVKKHTKHLRRGGSSAPMGAPRRARPNPAALAAMMGGAGPAAPMGAPMGAPGMAHGGGVHHHHHHYYGGGAIETPHTAGPEAMIKGKSKHGDGAAKKGHTKGTVR